MTRRDLGKLTDRQVWLLGLNVDHALRPLGVGQTTPWGQEGQTLHLLRVLSIEPETVLGYEQAQPQIEALLLMRAKKAAGKLLYEAILEDVEFRFAAGFEAEPAAKRQKAVQSAGARRACEVIEPVARASFGRPSQGTATLAAPPGHSALFRGAVTPRGAKRRRSQQGRDGFTSGQTSRFFPEPRRP